MRVWRNGRRARFRFWSGRLGAGSSPVTRTKTEGYLVVHLGFIYVRFEVKKV